MTEYQVVVTPNTDTVTIKNDDGELVFSGRHAIAALARDIDLAVAVLFEPADDTVSAEDVRGILSDTDKEAD